MFYKDETLEKIASDIIRKHDELRHLTDEEKLEMLISEVKEIYAKGFIDGVEDEREHIKAGKQM